MNSAALRLAGYERGVTQPHDGEIVCDESGDPTGTLREWGAWLDAAPGRRLIFMSSTATPPVPQ